MYQAYWEKGTLSVFIEERFCHNSVRIFVKKSEGDREFLLVQSPESPGGLIFKEFNPEEAVQIDDSNHLLELRRDLFAGILEAMTKYATANGIEPDSLSAIKATLKAKEEHLEDLRSILEQKMTIKLPNRKIVRNAES